MTEVNTPELEYNVTLAEVQSWTSTTKVKLSSIVADIMQQISSEVIGRLGTRYVVKSWVSPSTTPAVVRKVICMKYVGWYYLRQFAEADAENAYGMRLLLEADSLLGEILNGSLILVDADLEDVKVTGLGFEPEESDPKFTMDVVY